MKLLICSDGSPQAENAVRFGALIAAACEAEVGLLGIVESPGDEERIIGAIRRGQHLLTEKRVHVDVIIKTGAPAQEIAKHTAETKYDLVVIGAVRRGVRGPYWMSLTAYKTVKLVSPPVLVVVGERRQLARILLCTSGTKHFDSAVELVSEIAHALAAGADLMHVMDPPPMLFGDMHQRQTDVDRLLNSGSALGRSLRHQREILEKSDVAVTVLLRQGLVQEEILSEARHGEYDLIVVGSQLTGGTFQTYMMGNITREIVNRAMCPVLVVRTVKNQNSMAHRLLRLFSKLGPNRLYYRSVAQSGPGIHRGALV